MKQFYLLIDRQSFLHKAMLTKVIIKTNHCLEKDKWPDPAGYVL